MNSADQASILGRGWIQPFDISGEEQTQEQADEVREEGVGVRLDDQYVQRLDGLESNGSTTDAAGGHGTKGT